MMMLLSIPARLRYVTERISDIFMSDCSCCWVGVSVAGAIFFRCAERISEPANGRRVGRISPSGSCLFWSSGVQPGCSRHRPAGLLNHSGIKAPERDAESADVSPA